MKNLHEGPTDKAKGGKDGGWEVGIGAVESGKNGDKCT